MITSWSPGIHVEATRRGHVRVKSLLTVGDGAASNGYEMAGIPDGLGLVRSERGDRDFRLLMNHELRGNRGVVRKHGTIGATGGPRRRTASTPATPATRSPPRRLSSTASARRASQLLAMRVPKFSAVHGIGG